MPASARAAVLIVAAIIVGIARAEEPTPLPLPVHAIGVRQSLVFDGRAIQTDYMLRAKYPATPALEHYLRVIREPWIRCQWSGLNWESFLDGTVKPTQTVHQQLHIWLNPKARRTLVLATKYFSAGQSAREPDNDDQRVVLMEYFAQNVREVARDLQLKCPPNAL